MVRWSARAGIAKVTAWSATGSAPAAAGVNTLPPSVNPTVAWRVPAITSARSQIVLQRSDGLLFLLDDKLQSLKTSSLPPKEQSIRTGGFYATGAWGELARSARLAALDGGKAESVLTMDARGALLCLDASAATNAIAPTLKWESPNTQSPLVAKLDGEKLGVAVVALADPLSDPPQHRVRVLRADGTTKWDVAIDAKPLADLVAGNFNSDAVPDLAFQYAVAGTVNLVTKALNGSDGASLWSTAPMFPGNGGLQSAGMSVRPRTGGPDSLLFQGAPTHELNGGTGAELTSGGPVNTYSLPVLVDTTGDGTDEVLLTAGFWPASLWSSDLKTALWTSADDDRPYPYPAIVTCGTLAVPTMVQGSYRYPSRLKITPLAGASAGVSSSFVLAGGKKWADETAAIAAGEFVGQLTSASAHANLTGTGAPIAVVGSSPGWLYGIDVCAGTVAFAVNFGAGVGEPTFGDTDGDGKDEIIVPTADGYLHGLKNQAVAKPAYVYDTDPEHGITATDVSVISSTDRLSATWAAVSGATAYEVTIVGADHKPLTTPVWKNVGAVTSTTVTGLSLTLGSDYYFAVRALKDGKTSPDAVSNGVTVQIAGDAGVDSGVDAGETGPSDDATTGDAAGPSPEVEGSGCSCETPARSQGSTPYLLFAALALFAASRARRPD